MCNSITDKPLQNKHPSWDSVDLLLPDINGILRGKRVAINALEKIQQNGICLPASLFGTNINGDTINETGLGLSIGEKDLHCVPVNSAPTPIPWKSGSAQVLITMNEENGTPFAINPREILRRIHSQFEQINLHPTIAVELEFYLIDEASQNSSLKAPINPVTHRHDDSTQVYYMDDLDAYSNFINAVQNACRIQNIPADAAVAEYAPGQFEINLKHTSNVIQACDDAIMLKRTIKHIAREYGYIATFMAKPFATQAGSGMHIHTSIYDYDRNNAFFKNESNLHHAIGGLQQSMNDAMLLFAPHANSYRRLQPDMYVPLSSAWGYNNRTVALRIPADEGKNLRIEHRIAGADANPYLVTAAVLAGIYSGLTKKTPCSPPVNGDAIAKVAASNPNTWLEALNYFKTSAWVSDCFGKQFQQVFATLKTSERASFEQQITPTEIKWYLHTS